LFAFGGRDRWAVVPIVAGSAALAVVYRPRFRASHRAVDAGLSLCLALGAAQLIPLGPAIRAALSPASASVDRALLLTPPDEAMRGRPHPLSLDPASTAWAVALAAAAVLLFWTARAIFERRGGLRTVSRGIVRLGLVLSIITFVQRALSPHLFYGLWRPIARTDTPTPFGAFLNRNDLATWLIMAIPLAAGYGLARIQSRVPASEGKAFDVEKMIDARMIWLVASLLLMTALLLASLSRSGIVGCAVGLLTLVILGRSRTSGRHFAWMLGGIALVGLAATAYVNVPALTTRLNDLFAPGLGRGRLTIWRQTWPMARDFWRTGLGVGAFERGMLVYQERPIPLFFNQAHDEYLQILVEGGVPLAVAAGLTVVLGWREAAARLHDDPSSVGWIRAGAAGGLVAVAVQSVWDTGLRMPANAVLFAVVAAIALHQRTGTTTSTRASPK
jgi:O-antigen ligase